MHTLARVRTRVAVHLSRASASATAAARRVGARSFVSKAAAATAPRRASAAWWVAGAFGAVSGSVALALGMSSASRATTAPAKAEAKSAAPAPLQQLPGWPARLSADVIAQTLSANARSLDFPDARAYGGLADGRVARLQLAQYNANPVCEDTCAVDTNAFANASAAANADSKSPARTKGAVLLGIFDGHSGTAASAFAAQELLQYVQYYSARGWAVPFVPVPTGEEPRAPSPTTAPVVAGSSVLNPLPFAAADADFLELALRERRWQDGLSGACMAVAHVDPSGLVTTANAGDCRAVIARRVPAAQRTTKALAVSASSSGIPKATDSGVPSADGGDGAGAAVLGDDSDYAYEAVALTQDHQIDTHPLERARLLREHPTESDVIRHNRVKGRLQPTRGLGDGLYKRPEFFAHHRIAQSDRYSATGWHAPYTTAHPDITRHALHPNDRYLVLSTDGLFQDMTNADVCDALTRFDRHPELQRAHNHNAAVYLVRTALERASVHAFGRPPVPASSPTADADASDLSLSAILQIPLKHRRRLHDDVTVLVVTLQPPTLDASAAAAVATASASAPVAVPATLAKLRGADGGSEPLSQPRIASKL